MSLLKTGLFKIKDDSRFDLVSLWFTRLVKGDVLNVNRCKHQVWSLFDFDGLQCKLCMQVITLHNDLWSYTRSSYSADCNKQSISSIQQVFRICHWRKEAKFLLHSRQLSWKRRRPQSFNLICASESATKIETSKLLRNVLFLEALVFILPLEVLEIWCFWRKLRQCSTNTRKQKYWQDL